MKHRSQQLPGRSRTVRTLLDDIRADQGDEAAPDRIGAAGEVPPAIRDRVVDDAEEGYAKLVSCPCCPGTHGPDMMVRVSELEGPMIDELPDEVVYICSWCDQHGRRTGRIAPDVP